MAVLLTFAAFAVWWGGAGKPLTRAESDAFLGQLQVQLAPDALEADGRTFERIRALMAQDEGGELYLVNIEKTRLAPVTPPGFQPSRDIGEAEKRYAVAVLPMQLKAGGVPVLVAAYKGDFLGAEPGFDRIAVVRWRSLRDFMRFVTSPEYQKVAPLKWAAVESTRLVAVKPALSLFLARTMLGLMVALVVCLLLMVPRRRSWAVDV